MKRNFLSLRHFAGNFLSAFLQLRDRQRTTRRKSDPPRVRYIKTVITGMRSFIALRRQKRRGPRANGKLGVALGILELADKRAVHSPLSLFSRPVSPLLSATSSSVVPELPLLALECTASASREHGRSPAFLCFLAHPPFHLPFVPPLPARPPMYSKLNCRYLSNVEINKPLTFL